MNRVIEKLLWKIGFFGPIPAPPTPRTGVDGVFAFTHDLPRNQPETVLLDGTEFELADGFSFYWMHREIYHDQVYKFTTNKKSPFIIDCGSNYGVSIAWFKRVYPESRIVAVEADPNIFNLLMRNINRRQFSDVRLLHRAVADNPGILPFHCLGADAGRLHLNSDDINGIPVQSVNVEAILLDDLINDEEVDFLKIDIEGAETDVLRVSKKLNQVSQLFIEYHSFLDQPQQLAELLSILKKEGFRYYLNKIFAPSNPYAEITTNCGMDLQMSIVATRV